MSQSFWVSGIWEQLTRGGGGGSGSASLTGLQSSCQPGRQSSQTGLVSENPLPSSLAWLLTSIPHQTVLSMGYLSVYKMWKPASPRMSNQKRERRKRLRKYSRCKLFESQKLNPMVFAVCCWSQRPTLIQCGKGPHRRGLAQSREALGLPWKQVITIPHRQQSFYM